MAVGYTDGDPNKLDKDGGTLTGPLLLEDGSAAASEQYVADQITDGSTASDLAAHEAATTSVHGIANTAVLETQAGSAAKVTTHAGASDPHGDRAYAAGQAAAAQTAAESYTDSAVTGLAADSAVVHKASNLADLPSASTARTNLGLGTAAVKDAPASGNAASGQVTLGSDTRLSDSRTPATHASTHATGGTDPVSAASIGALTAASNLSDLANATTARANLGLGTAATQASSAFDAAGLATAAQNASLQKSSNLSDVATPGTARTNLGLGTSAVKDIPSSGNASSAQVVYGTDTRLSDTRTPSSTLAHASTHGTAGSDPVSLDASQVATGTLAIGRIPTGTADASHVTLANDSRLSDSRTPTAHATSHKTGGSDAFTAADVGGLLITSNLSDLNNAGTARTNLGLGSAATHATTDYMATGTGLLIASNLSDLNNAATARTNLGVPSTARQIATTSLLSGGGDLTADRTLSTIGLGPQPIDQGFIDWSWDPQFTTSTGAVPGSGVVQVTKLRMRAGSPISTIYLIVGATGTQPSNVVAGLFDASGNLITNATGTVAVATWNTTGIHGFTLTAPAAIATGAWYYVGWFVNGATSASVLRTNSSGLTFTNNANLAGTAAGTPATAFRAATADTGRTTTLPSSLGTLTAVAQSWWVAVA